jgi:hypothetical protein
VQTGAEHTDAPVEEFARHVHRTAVVRLDLRAS